MDLSRYRDLFVSESREHLSALGSLNMRYDESAAAADTINEMFRHAHSLKGMAATMQILPVSHLAHAMEDLLGQVRDGRFHVSRHVSDLLFAAIDTLEQMVDMVAKGGELPDADELSSRIRNYSPSPEQTALPVATSAPVVAEQPPAPEDFSFRISDDTSTIRIKTSLLDRLVSISGELLTVRHAIEDAARISADKTINLPLRELSSLLRQLQDEVFMARMLPFGTIAERYPRMVRELARKSGKEVSFRISGDSIELDRGVLELVIEPLMHLLRNAVDHGLETPSERVACGKPPVGNLQLKVNRMSDYVLVEIIDDGRGIDPERIRTRALDKGLLTARQASALTSEDLLMLICTPGFSTAKTVTEISGRGVGMDVVKNAIQTIGGTLSIDSTPGHGSAFTLHLPLSVAIIHALMVACGELLLAVPVSSILSTLEVKPDDIIRKGRELFIVHAGKEIPLRNLPGFFRQHETVASDSMIPVLLTESNRQVTGLLVHKLLGQQEIFTRPLRPPLSELRGVSGACLSRTGQIVFVVDPAGCSDPLLKL